MYINNNSKFHGLSGGHYFFPNCFIYYHVIYILFIVSFYADANWKKNVLSSLLKKT